METSQPLTIESFSYSWLINRKPSLDAIFDNNEDYTDCYKEENVNSFVNSQGFHKESHNFRFDLPICTPNLVHADEIFFNGRMIPKSINEARLHSSPATPVVHFLSKSPSKYKRSYSQLLANWRVSSKRVLRKCFSFLIPRKSIRIVDSSMNLVRLSSSVLTHEQMSERSDVYTTTLGRTKSWSPNSTYGPHFSCSKNESCDYDERSILEAVVHCKRSFES
ncbi:probable membrane-associated kinase regulator 6 [Cynara cardunculus var. scolymus]|uniref:probable membrane-associated kinase regulator 6 n=1 Tax=Cynara cardunculus var. scolymus TaxID=59895 RepID=UPI000D62DD92|nr:probable membrane-associated kinase regulator 6 [Cynara cardunculus var. scolymus]